MDVNWVLFQGSLTNASNFAAVALSAPVTFTDRSKPAHGRLARTSSTDEIRVSWTVPEGSREGRVLERAGRGDAAAPGLDRRSARLRRGSSGRIGDAAPSDGAARTPTRARDARRCPDCAVRWGLAASNLTRVAADASVTAYASSDLCGAPANASGFHPPGDFHTVVLDLAKYETDEARAAGLAYWHQRTACKSKPAAATPR